MKIYNLDSEIVIDRIPFIFDPNRKIFLTTLVHIETPTLPKIFPKIYLSKELKTQFVLFLKRRGIKIGDENFYVWKPFEPEIITLSNGTAYEVLPCCPQDITTNMLLVFRQASIITHVYVGLCSELKSTLLNKTLISWLKGNNVKTDMYIPVNKASKRCIECEFREVIVEIERKVNAETTAKILIQLPLFGSESFIAKVASEFRGCVALCGLVRELYTILPTAETQYLTVDIKMARIIIAGSDFTENLSSNFECDYGRITNKSAIKWSPLPTPIELNLLSDLVRPKRVYGIPFRNNFEILEQPVQISILGWGSNPQSARKFIQGQWVTVEKCCHEKYQTISQQVENIKNILKCVSKRQDCNQMLSKEEDLTEEQPTSSHLNKKTNQLPDIEKYTDNSKRSATTYFGQQSEKQVPISVRCESNLAEKYTESSNPLVENIVGNNPRLEKSKAGQTENDLTSNPAVNLQQNSSHQLTATNLCSKSLTNASTSSQTKRKLKATKCPPINTLVYRKGKKGIHFVDEDSNSSD